MQGEVSTLLLAATAAGTTIQSSAIWKQIKLAKEILEFIAEFPEWINYNRNLEEHLQTLKRKMESLESLQADVIIELENTEHQSGKKRKREVKHWLRCVKRKAFDIQKVENDFNRVSYLPRFLFRAWIGSCIGKEIQQVNELVEQGSFSGLLIDASQNCREPLVTNVLKGLVVLEKLDEIWGHLISREIVRIGVQGAEGIGKSAVMAQVYNRLCTFHSVYYVNIPEECNVYSLQASIAEEMKVKLPQPKGSEAKRAARIFQVLKNMKEFVLILDGLTQHVSLSDVGIPMEGNTGKLIVTSRCSNVCRKMCFQKLVVLESLSREESESLFMEKLAVDVPLSEEIRIIAADIIEKCKGIPLSILNMAVQLRGVSDVNEWKCILSEM